MSAEVVDSPVTIGLVVSSEMFGLVGFGAIGSSVIGGTGFFSNELIACVIAFAYPSTVDCS